MALPPPISEAQWLAQLARDGLTVERWTSSPGAVYETHEHPYGKILVVRSGSITFTLYHGSTAAASADPQAGSPRCSSSMSRVGLRRGTEFTIRHGERVVMLQPGDRLELPPRTPHRAVVGPAGVVCLEAHRPVGAAQSR